MIILPSPPRRASLISFWLAISVICGLLFGVFSSLLISPRLLGTGAILTFVLALPGLLWPSAISIPYKVWNKLAHYFSQVAVLLLNGICFYIVLVAVGRTGSSLLLTRPPSGKSLWVPRKTLSSDAYPSQYWLRAPETHDKPWFVTFCLWAKNSGNLWAVSLLPFLILLSAFEIHAGRRLPTNIYTLY